MEEKAPEQVGQKQGTTLASIELGAEHLGAIQKARAKVGSRVRVVLYGTIQEIVEQAGDATEEGVQAAKIVMNVSNFKYAGNNEIADLFEEELDG